MKLPELLSGPAHDLSQFWRWIRGLPKLAKLNAYGLAVLAVVALGSSLLNFILKLCSLLAQCVVAAIALAIGRANPQTIPFPETESDYRFFVTIAISLVVCLLIVALFEKGALWPDQRVSEKVDVENDA